MYSLGKAIYLTARFQVVHGTSNFRGASKKAFAELAATKFFYLTNGGL